MSAMPRVLIVTADPMLARAYRARLVREGYDAHVCATGHDGLAIAHQTSPEIIMLDLVMPGMHGLDVLKALRDVPWVVTSHVVMLVDHTLTAETLEECLFWGAGSFVRKDSSSAGDLVAHLKKIPARPKATPAAAVPSAS
jgi:DNA-binding response OmpR family regulator